MLTDLSFSELLARFSASDPTPGGGSAAAMASAVGAALLAMVAGLPKTRAGTGEDRAALAAAAAALDPVRRDLAAAVDRDAGAYDEVMAAYRLAKSTAEEQAARKAAIQRALRDAADVPLGVMRRSVDALEQAVTIAAHGYPAASSDVGVALALLVAGAGGARLNVDANLAAIADGEYRDRAAAESVRLIDAAEALAERARQLLR